MKINPITGLPSLSDIEPPDHLAIAREMLSRHYKVSPDRPRYLNLDAIKDEPSNP